MEIAKRDINIGKLKEELEYRRKFLLSKRNELLNIQHDNKYLLGIANDYERYYSKIKEERKQQLEAMQVLSDYVSKIANDTDITDELVTQSRHQQREIMNELERLKKELDEIL